MSSSIPGPGLAGEWESRVPLAGIQFVNFKEEQSAGSMFPLFHSKCLYFLPLHGERPDTQKQCLVSIISLGPAIPQSLLFGEREAGGSHRLEAGLILGGFIMVELNENLNHCHREDK